MLIFLTLLSLSGWLYLGFAHGRFWDPPFDNAAPEPTNWPTVDIVVPARDEADILPRTLPSLLTQDYPGSFRVVLVNDHSTDGTAAIARATAFRQQRAGILTVIDAPNLPEGWSGKVAAMQAGLTHSQASFVLFTDADILHPPQSLRRLVARAEADQLDLTSLMVKLHCNTWAEKLMVPAFVFFFAMLYPFSRANNPQSKIAAAAGGVMLVRREVLNEAGGLEKIKGALIDDCSLAGLIKTCSGRIRLTLTHDVHSLRIYKNIGEIHNMIARTAYTQLQHSPLWLGLCLAGLYLLFLHPFVALATGGITATLLGLAVFYEAFVLYRPTIRFYGRSLPWAASLPLAAIFYMVATIASAIRYHKGQGGQWKNRIHNA